MKSEKRPNLVIRKLIVLGISATLLFSLYMFVPGYHWTVQTYIGGNAAWMTEYPILSDLTKKRCKYGPLKFEYIYKIATSTPTNAVVILPPDSCLYGDSCTKLREQAWTAYHLYPRKVIYADEKVNISNYTNVYWVGLNGWTLAGVAKDMNQGFYMKKAE